MRATNPPAPESARGPAPGVTRASICPRPGIRRQEKQAADLAAELPPVSAGGDWRPRAPVVGVPATAGTNVVALVRGDDPDGDPLTFRFTWTVNGVQRPESGPQLSLGRLRHGDVVQVSVVASDGLLDSAPFVSLPIPVENAAPAFTSLPGAPGGDGVFRYSPLAADPEGDRNLRYALLEAPVGMEFSTLTGEITWRPRLDQVGRHAVEISVEDSVGARATQRFELVID